MKILAIETSCDDTGIAILEVKGKRLKVLSNIVSSQTIHANYGGVFPMMAKREHQRNLPLVLKKALEKGKLLKLQNANIKLQNDNVKFKMIANILEKESNLFLAVKEFLQTHEKPNVDMIAVTNGPGLEPCLYVGVNFAKALSYFWDIPVVPVNHIEAHILVNFLENPKIQFPAISLIVSGGHTQLILVKNPPAGGGSYQIIGETRDDAAGECFDKAARILGLGYPGGPAIAKIAAQWKKQDTRNNNQTKLPRPMINSKDYDFSFSGLKTAVLYAVRDKKQETITKQYVQEMCHEVQDAICEVLIKKTLAAAKDYNAKTIIVGGGVSANSELRRQFQISNFKFQILFPKKELSTDNGLMIAVAGYFNRTKKIAWQKLSVHANLRV